MSSFEWIFNTNPAKIESKLKYSGLGALKVHYMGGIYKIMNGSLKGLAHEIFKIILRPPHKNILWKRNF